MCVKTTYKERVLYIHTYMGILIRVYICIDAYMCRIWDSGRHMYGPTGNPHSLAQEQQQPTRHPSSLLRFFCSFFFIFFLRISFYLYIFQKSFCLYTIIGSNRDQDVHCGVKRARRSKRHCTQSKKTTNRNTNITK